MIEKGVGAMRGQGGSSPGGSAIPPGDRSAKCELKYVGHPFVDVGAATIAAYFGKQRPEDVTAQEMEDFADYLRQQYQRKYLSSYLTCVFPNSAYVNPTSGEEKRKDYWAEHLYAYRELAGAEEGTCVLCGEPARVRAYRQHVPMLTGVGVVNFFPGGNAGLRLCPACMLSIAAAPLGCLWCGGKALLVHTDDPNLTFRFAKQHLAWHQRRLALDGDKYPGASQPQTRVIDNLRKLAAEAMERHEDAVDKTGRPTSLTAYHFTNSGQGPDIRIYHLPGMVFAFLMEAEADAYSEQWHKVVAAAWRTKEASDDRDTHRNYLYEDLFRLPDEWQRFVRIYLCRAKLLNTGKDDPRGDYGLDRDLDKLSWPLTELFLERVAGMDKHRIETIRTLADSLAKYIMERDYRLLRELHLARSYRGFRVALVNASVSEQRAGRPPLVTFDDFVTVFEYGEEDPRPDWSLSRDLVLLRILEQLYESHWLPKHADVLDFHLAEPSDALASGPTNSEEGS
jgi:CRISPR-associated protein Cst1